MSAAAIWFADTSFWIAVSQKTDQYHDRASAWSDYLLKTDAFILTTEAVLWEWMNALANSTTRRATTEGYRRCHQDPQIEVVPFDVDVIAAASHVYESRSDKDWSLTDCLSFLVMEQRRVPRALTTDHHFRQAGFEAVLLGEPPAADCVSSTAESRSARCYSDRSQHCQPYDPQRVCEFGTRLSLIGSNGPVSLITAPCGADVRPDET